jgi:hypothetical protein
MKTFSAGHRCPACHTHRVERRAHHGWFERTVLPRLSRHAYVCLECQRRFWDRPHRRHPYRPPEESEVRPRRRRRRSRWRMLRRMLRRPPPLEVTPYSRVRVYLAIGLAWAAVLLIFFALRGLWPAATMVRGFD